MKASRHHLRTRARSELADITATVAAAVRASGMGDGLCAVYCPHTTAAITINEAADPDVRADIASFLARLIPADAGFAHCEGNSDAHLKTSLVGPSVLIPVQDGEMLLGKWQGVYFCEFDGPRDRFFWIKLVKDHNE